MRINGVKRIKLKKFNNIRGDLLKYISKNDNFFEKFGEVYFTEIKKKPKGWNYHKYNKCLIAVPYGKVQFTLVDGRKKKTDFNKRLKISIGKKNYFLLIIPPKVWFSFRSLTNFSLIANLIKTPHSKLEIKKRDI